MTCPTKTHPTPTTRRAHLTPTAALTRAAVLLLGLGLGGCTGESISDSGGGGSYRTGGGRYYRGEINELDLLGVNAGSASESEIRRSLHDSGGSGGVHARPGSPLLVIQSGALAPDSAMVGVIEKSYRVFPFSGIPSAPPTADAASAGNSTRDGTLARKLRLAAARLGCTHVLCYWGVVEAVEQGQLTKTVSWVPFAGDLIPDENRTARLRVRAVLMDVASGRAAAFTPPPVENSALSPGLLREYSRDKQTCDLKSRAYAALVNQMAGRTL